MNIVHVIHKDGYTLTHSWVVDSFGFKRNAFSLFDEKNRVYIPFVANLRVNNYTRDTRISGDDISKYSDKEYEDMFQEQLNKLTKWKEYTDPNAGSNPFYSPV